MSEWATMIMLASLYFIIESLRENATVPPELIEERFTLLLIIPLRGGLLSNVFLD